uniref:T9SS type A sorting domain-containing protein n=1 Tax=Ignavibacterium album TaxID=591197 RepID=A0A7V2ZIU6_9BACT
MKTILYLILFVTSGFSQVTQEWISRYNRIGNSFESPAALSVDNLGNVYVAGSGYSTGVQSDIIVIKYNSAGVQQWVQFYNGPGNSADGAYDMVTDNNGNVFITGFSIGTSTDQDIVTIKYNTDGIFQWAKIYDRANQQDFGSSIAVDNLGNVYVTGASYRIGTSLDFITIKYNSNGEQQWVKLYEGSSEDVAAKIVLDDEGNSYVTGTSLSSTNNDYLTIKYNYSGIELWTARFDYNQTNDEASSLVVDKDGNVYVTGYTTNPVNLEDCATVKYDPNGNQQWVSIYNGIGNETDKAYSIAVNDDGSVYLTGESFGNGSRDIVTIKYNFSGVQQWVQRYNGQSNYSDYGKSLAVDEAGNVYVGGTTYENSSLYDFILIKYNNDGVQAWVETYNGPVNSFELFSGLKLDRNRNIYITGWSEGNDTGNDFATIKYSQVHYPVLIVPGVAGTYASDVDNDLYWLTHRGAPPEQIQIDPLANVYTDLITTLQNAGYEKDKDLFIVNYDWRLLPAPIDNNFDGYIEGLTGQSISDNQFNYGVDYLGYYLREAANQWRIDYNEELEYVDVIVHSTGGLVTRSYIQSSAYGDVYDAVNNYKLPRIRNFMMIGVPNRGASKAWNPLHDNWIADPAYRFVLSKIINRAYQKIKKGYIITGPDHYITWGSILDSLGNPDKVKFINRYVPTIRGLLATYDFLDIGSGPTNVNNNPSERNNLILDLNNGYDLYPNADPNGFLDSAIVYVLFGNGQNTFDYVQERTDGEFNAIQSFTDWTRSSVLPGTLWYKDMINSDNNGDGTVPLQSSIGQFLGDSRAILLPFGVSNHTGMVQTIPVQSTVLDILNINYDQSTISTGSGADFGNVLSIISDPVESVITDGLGRRVGYTNSTGKLTEIPNSLWIGNTEGMGYVFGSVPEPITLQLTGLGEEYYVMVSAEDSNKAGGVVLEGFLASGAIITYLITLQPLSVEKLESLNPDNFTLAQNYPNPFNPTTTIQYSIPQRGNVSLKVYDVLGNEVSTLVNEEKERGVYSVNFDASHFSSGIYFYRLKADNFIQTKKMILVR